LTQLLKTYRADPSDALVFENAANAGEWAVSGAFMFARRDGAALTGKRKRAFEIGFLGLESLGRSTFAQVVEASAGERVAATELLARQLMTRFGAPDMEHAQAAAAEEIAFAESLAAHPPGTLIAVLRLYEQGDVRETFRALSPRRATGPLRVFGLDRDTP